MPAATTASNRHSIKPATIVSLSGAPEEINTHLGLLPSSPNVLILPPINVHSHTTSSPLSALSTESTQIPPKHTARELVQSIHTAYQQRHAQAEAFTSNHPSRGAILQKGWTVLLAECAQHLIDTGVCETVEEASQLVKEACDGYEEEEEKEEEFEVEVEVSDSELEKTPTIEEEEYSGDEQDTPVSATSRHHSISRLSHSSSSTTSSSASRNRHRVSEQHRNGSMSLNGDSIHESEEMDSPILPLRHSNIQPLNLRRPESANSMRESIYSNASTSSNKRNPAPIHGKDGKRFPVKAVSMDNLSAAAAAAAAATSNHANGVMQRKNSLTDSSFSPEYSENKELVPERKESIAMRESKALRDSVIVTERRRILEERLAEERQKSNVFHDEDGGEPGLTRKRSFRSASHSGHSVRQSSTWSHRESTTSLDSWASTPTRMLDEMLPKKRTKKVKEKRMVKVKTKHPSLVFPKEDVVIFLHNEETSPTTIKLMDSLSQTIHTTPQTPFSPSFPSALAPYPSPPISPTTPPAIVIEQPPLNGNHVPPKLSLFPTDRRKITIVGVDAKPSQAAKQEHDSTKRESAAIAELAKPIPKKINPGTSVKKIKVTDYSPLQVQNEIRRILGETMVGVRKFPTVVQGLALGMGMGLGLLNGGGEGMVNKFWAPVLGGNGPTANVDMIFAIGWERGCERWGQKVQGRLMAGLGRTGLATSVSLSFLLSSSLHLLSPLSPTYTSQVHAALSGKLLVPQIEEFLSLHTSTRVLVITFDASTIPNANLEPIRELKRVLGGSSSEAAFKVISVIGGSPDGEEEKPPTPPKSVQTSPKKPAKNGYRTSPIPPANRHSNSPPAEKPPPAEQPKLKRTPSQIRSDEKTLFRRKELANLSDFLLVNKGKNEMAFEEQMATIAVTLHEREDFTGYYKRIQEREAALALQEREEEELEDVVEEPEPEPEVEIAPPPPPPQQQQQQQHRPPVDDIYLPEFDDEDDDDDISYNEAVMSVGVSSRSSSMRSGRSEWSNKMSWGANLLGKHKKQKNGPRDGKAFKLLGIDG